MFFLRHLSLCQRPPTHHGYLGMGPCNIFASGPAEILPAVVELGRFTRVTPSGSIDCCQWAWTKP